MNSDLFVKFRSIREKENASKEELEIYNNYIESNYSKIDVMNLIQLRIQRTGSADSFDLDVYDNYILASLLTDPPHMKQITINTLDTAFVIFSDINHDSIADVKTRIAVKTGMVSGLIHLFYEGKELNNSEYIKHKTPVLYLVYNSVSNEAKSYHLLLEHYKLDAFKTMSADEIRMFMAIVSKVQPQQFILEKQDEKQLEPPTNMKNSLKYILSLESIDETSENED